MYLHRKNWRHVFQWIKIISTNLELFVQIYYSNPAIFQARSQAEVRKHGLQHYMGIDARNPVFIACK